MSAQNQKPLSEDEIVNMLEDIFEHSEIQKTRLQELWNIISDRYV